MEVFSAVVAAVLPCFTHQLEASLKPPSISMAAEFPIMLPFQLCLSAVCTRLIVQWWWHQNVLNDQRQKGRSSLPYYLPSSARSQKTPTGWHLPRRIKYSSAAAFIQAAGWRRGLGVKVLSTVARLNWVCACMIYRAYAHREVGGGKDSTFFPYMLEGPRSRQKWWRTVTLRGVCLGMHTTQPGQLLEPWFTTALHFSPVPDGYKHDFASSPFDFSSSKPANPVQNITFFKVAWMDSG